MQLINFYSCILLKLVSLLIQKKKTAEKDLIEKNLKKTRKR